MSNQIKIDVSQLGQNVKIENRDGVIVITPMEEEGTKLPEVGYYSDIRSDIYSVKDPTWGAQEDRNLYPRKNHAILVGQILAPLLVKHWELTGGYWEGSPLITLVHNGIGWVLRANMPSIPPCAFPFTSKGLADQFFRENQDQLNELARLWQEG